jgi:hypothetical protein
MVNLLSRPAFLKDPGKQDYFVPINVAGTPWHVKVYFVTY